MLATLRYSFRVLLRAPLFSATIILTIAVAIAANTTIFSVVNAVLLRSLPFKAPGSLVQVAEKNDKLNLPVFTASVPNFVSWRQESRSFAAIGGIAFNNYTLTGDGGEPEQLTGNRLSPSVIPVLGVSPVVGRAFTPEEEKPGAVPVAMIGEGLWKRRFGADRGIVGRVLTLNAIPTTIIGVAPAALNMFSGADVYTPLVVDLSKELRLNHQTFVVGRLRDGLTLAQAQQEMNAVSRHVGQQYPEVKDWGTNLISFRDTFVSSQLRTGLVVLSFAVGLVLLIACANVANLLLARGVARKAELAIRTAMGAERARLVRQLFAESALMAAIGGGIGLGAAALAVMAINKLLPPNTLPVSTVSIDASVLAFSAGLTILTGMLFGLAPAMRSASVNLNDVLKEAGRGSSGVLGRRLRNSLAAGQLALATILLVGASQLIQSLRNLERVKTGFDPSHLATFELSPPQSRYALDSTRGASLLYADLLDRLRAIPGVTDAAISSGIPFGAGSYTTHPMLTDGRSVLPAGTLVPIDWRIVSPGFFKALRIPVLRGRNFTDADDGRSQKVIIVSQATAKKFWGDEDPIGRTLTRSADRKTAFTVIGVVGDTRNASLNQETPTMYYPSAMRVWPLMDVVVRSNAPMSEIMPQIRQKIRERDAELALANVRAMDEWVSNSAAQPRLNSELLGTFAGFALFTAILGIYGVLAYSVSRRLKEIGLRMAIGATPSRVLGLIVGEGMTIALTGVGLGIVGGLALGRSLSSLVYGVTSHDPVTFVAVPVVLTVVALAACVVPASRAARLDPIVVLRSD